MIREDEDEDEDGPFSQMSFKLMFILNWKIKVAVKNHAGSSQLSESEYQ